MSIADLSTLISSIALAGVALSLYLQGGQLRSSQTQATTAAHIELMKFGLQYPALAGDLVGVENPDEFVRGIALNWHVAIFKHLTPIRLLPLGRLERDAVRTEHLLNLMHCGLVTDDHHDWLSHPGDLPLST